MFKREGCCVVLNLPCVHIVFFVPISSRMLIMRCDLFSSLKVPAQHCDLLLWDDLDLPLSAELDALLVATGGHWRHTIRPFWAGLQSDLQH